MYTFALIVEVMVFIALDPLNDMQQRVMNDLGNLLVFFRQPPLYVSFKWHLRNVATWLMQIVDYFTEYHFHPILHMPWLFLLITL